MAKIFKSTSTQIFIIGLCLTFAICKIDNMGYTVEEPYVETHIPEILEDSIQ